MLTTVLSVRWRHILVSCYLSRACAFLWNFDERARVGSSHFIFNAAGRGHLNIKSDHYCIKNKQKPVNWHFIVKITKWVVWVQSPEIHTRNPFHLPYKGILLFSPPAWSILGKRTTAPTFHSDCLNRNSFFIYLVFLFRFQQSRWFQHTAVFSIFFAKILNDAKLIIWILFID